MSAENFSVVRRIEGSIQITWDPFVGNVRIVRKRGSYPADETDGDNVYEGDASGGLFVDTGNRFVKQGSSYQRITLEDATYYYYKMFLES